MSSRWSDWVHLMCSTYEQWSPGDPRGFRDHDHRIHSSGDYRNPPPAHEHAGLLRLSQSSMKTPVELSLSLRDGVSQAFVSKLEAVGCSLAVLAVASTHVHALVLVGDQDAKTVFGQAKQFASHQIRDQLPGRVWGQGCHVVRVRDRAHYHSVYAYIKRHEQEGAVVWANPDLRSSGPASK